MEMAIPHNRVLFYCISMKQNARQVTLQVASLLYIQLLVVSLTSDIWRQSVSLKRERAVHKSDFDQKR